MSFVGDDEMAQHTRWMPESGPAVTLYGGQVPDKSSLSLYVRGEQEHVDTDVKDCPSDLYM